MPQPRPGHSYIRPEVRAEPGVPAIKIDPDIHRLHWNENPFDFPADLKEEVMQRVAHMPWSHYPRALRPFDLIDAIAKFHGLQSSQVVVGGGSSDMLKAVIAAVLQTGDHMLTHTPTFPSYAMHAHHASAVVHEVELDPANDFALPVETILDRASHHRVKLIIICAPNNPTGTIYPLTQLRRIVLESDALVVIDAAYGEFSGQDLRPLLAEAENVVLVHTFSKAYALAGARVGYTLSSPAIAAELQKLVTNFTLSTFSEVAATVALENSARFQPMIAAIISERERLAAALAKLPGVRVFPSGTNFLLVHLGQPAKEAQAYLYSREKLLVSTMSSYPGYEEYLRISIGTPAQNDIVISGLASYLATVAA